jgi:hypothetical protein
MMSSPGLAGLFIGSFVARKRTPEKTSGCTR